MMRIDVLTLFPEMFASPLDYSIIARARTNKLIEVVLSNIRDFADGRHRKVDDKPYGGGAGMVMTCQPLLDCLTSVQASCPAKAKVILLTPQGRRFDQEMAKDFAAQERLILIAGRYEGFDERIKIASSAEQVSVGDYILSGGELAAMVVIDAVTRLLPGALGDERSAQDDSFSDGLLEYPHYTRPAEFDGMKVPEVLLSGNHSEISAWRKRQSLERTKKTRPDLLSGKAKLVDKNKNN